MKDPSVGPRHIGVEPTRLCGTMMCSGCYAVWPQLWSVVRFDVCMPAQCRRPNLLEFGEEGELGRGERFSCTRLLVPTSAVIREMSMAACPSIHRCR